MAGKIYPDTLDEVIDLAARAAVDGSGSTSMKVFMEVAKAAGFNQRSGGYIRHPEVEYGADLARSWPDLASLLASWHLQALRLIAAGKRMNGGH
jgi:hypothetical protein